MDVYNEYVNVDVIRGASSGRHIVTYEPLDHRFDPSSISCQIMFGNDTPDIGLRVSGLGFRDRDFRGAGDVRLQVLFPVDAERNRGILTGVLREEDRAFKLIWDRHPGEHYICISYQTMDFMDTYKEEKPNWILEGF